MPRVLLLSLALTSIYMPSAQAASRQGLRVASPQEGEAIVQAAWQLRHGLFPKPDCSHFVHAVYTQAGFQYTYAASGAVFAGIEHFRRVSKPQSGDVIAWRGHIGIVIDPKEHSFYSSVTAGFAIQSYQSRYWTGRGVPRFYRFLVDDGQSPPPVLTDLALRSSAQSQALSGLMRSFTARPPTLIQSQMLAQLASSKVPAQETTPARTAQTQGEYASTPNMEARPVKEEVSDATMNSSRMSDQAIVTSQPKPVKQEVLAAVSQSIDLNGERMLRGGTLDSQPSVVLIDRLKIVAIKLEGNVGLADLEVKQVGTLKYGSAVPARITTIRHVILSHQEQGWTMIMPQNLVCLDRHHSVVALSDHLASGPQNSLEARDSSRLLNELLSERSLWHPSTWFRLSRSSGRGRSAPEKES